MTDALWKIVDDDDPVNPNQLMGRMRLFTEDGTPIALGELLTESGTVLYAAGEGFDASGATDSSPALQAKINEASAAALATAAGRVTVVIPGGSKLKVGGVVPKSNVSLRSDGGALISNGNTQGIITNRTAQVPVTNFRVENIEFVGDGQTVGDVLTERRGAVNIYNGTDIYIGRCRISGFSFQGISLLNCQQSWIVDNNIWDTCNTGAGNAIHASIFAASLTPNPQLSNSLIIRGNMVRNCRTAPVCIQTAYDTTIPATYVGYDVVISDNPRLEAVGDFAAIALECGRTGGIGTSSQGSRIRKVHIHHNHCYLKTSGGSTNGAGISVTDNNGSGGGQSTDSAEFDEITIDHNTIESSGRGIVSQASRAFIDHNSVKLSASGFNGIVAQRSSVGHTPSRISIDNNFVSMPANGGDGIVAQFVDSPRIFGNDVLYATGSTTSTGRGIYASNCTRPRIRYNEVRLTPQYGIRVDTCSDIVVSQNVVTDPCENGVGNGDGYLFNNITRSGQGNVRNMVSDNAMYDNRAVQKVTYAFNATGTNQSLIGKNNQIAGAGSFLYGGTWSTIIGTVSDYPSSPATPIVIAPGASPYTHANNDPYPNEIHAYGGAVTKVEWRRGSSTVDTGQTSGHWRLEQGDSLIVTYTAVPTMFKVAWRN